MALNKFMHPRNIYKTPPDFLTLAKKYKDFSDIAKVDVTGKVSIDFKDPHALRVLTKCLLKSDFKLDVVIPNDRLVPTLPLRLNYILWIEDLLAVMNRKSEIIRGLDIGTGACAIYPLLAAVKNNWHMIGTENDEGSIMVAKDNVIKNNLSDFIELKSNTTSSMIEFLFLEENAHRFEFCMCNPPFYTNIQELWESRSPARPAPKNGFTGSPHELITEGGELQFCRKIIEESKIYKDKILIFTTMVGHKYNLKELVVDLKAESIKYTTTEFCQGRVTRWGLAWTYQDYDFSKLGIPKNKSIKKNVPLVFTLPELPAPRNNMENTVETLKTILQDLKIMLTIVSKRKTELIIKILAHSNTWSNQRRKRRLNKQLLEDTKKQKLLSTTNVTVENNTPIVSMEKPTVGISMGSNETNEKSFLQEATTKFQLQKDEKYECNETAIVEGIMKMYTKDNEIKIHTEYLNGSAGKEGLHQIVQYIKNNWNYIFLLFKIHSLNYIMSRRIYNIMTKLF